MVTDRQVGKSLRLLESGCSWSEAALKSGIDVKTVRKCRRLGRMPSDMVTQRTWRTHRDVFDGVWEEVCQRLEESPGLEAKTLFDWLCREGKGDFQSGQLRTFQRRVKEWRALHGPSKEVFFAQVHHPGRLSASDFTSMNELAVRFGGHRFDHMVYHFVLTYSNWEAARVCFSKSFESLAEGLQQALFELGGVPKRHRTDRLSAAVNNLSERKEFTRRYQALMDHYGLRMEKTQPDHGNENGAPPSDDSRPPGSRQPRCSMTSTSPPGRRSTSRCSWT